MSTSSPASNEKISIDPLITKSEFCSNSASKSLRVTCYGSSSSKTPGRYLKAAKTLGYTLAKRGHICVNGCGSYGCMSAMNDGALIGNGHIVGVIHEMFVVDGYFGDKKVIDRDGGAHEALTKSVSDNSKEGPIREIMVAGGDDLQERKRLLVKNADALVVLPGGPGTWDELWEMACARQLGLVQLPIVCVNVDSYYDPFQEMLQRAYEDELIKLKPEEIVYFASTVEEAIRWIEMEVGKNSTLETKSFPRRSSSWKRSSFYSPPPLSDENSPSLLSVVSSAWSKTGVVFTGGLALGFGIALATIRGRH